MDRKTRSPLKEVLINILSNAIKFTDAPGSVTFTVERIAVFEAQTHENGTEVDHDACP